MERLHTELDQAKRHSQHISSAATETQRHLYEQISDLQTENSRLHDELQQLRGDADRAWPYVRGWAGEGSLSCGVDRDAMREDAESLVVRVVRIYLCR